MRFNCHYRFDLRFGKGNSEKGREKRDSNCCLKTARRQCQHFGRESKMKTLLGAEKMGVTNLKDRQRETKRIRRQRPTDFWGTCLNASEEVRWMSPSLCNWVGRGNALNLCKGRVLSVFKVSLSLCQFKLSCLEFCRTVSNYKFSCVKCHVELYQNQIQISGNSPVCFLSRLTTKCFVLQR